MLINIIKKLYNK